MFRLTIFIFLLFPFSFLTFGQKIVVVDENISHYSPYPISINGTKLKDVFHPLRGGWDHQLKIPYIQLSYSTNSKAANFQLQFYDEEQLNNDEIKCLNKNQNYDEAYSFKVHYSENRGKGILFLKGNSMRKSIDGKFYKLTQLKGQLIEDQSENLQLKNGFVQNSVLSSGGSWYKLGIVEDGIYKLDFQNMLSYGIINGNVNSDAINIFGNATGMLNEVNGSLRVDDLKLNNILIEDGGDGIFNIGDYVLFYARGPHSWELNGEIFEHEVHYYSDTAFYFVNIGGVNLPARIGSANTTNSSATHFVNQFTDYDFLEKDDFNLLKSGAEWYGDIFDVQTSYNYVFDFPNLASDTSYINCRLIGKSPSSSTFFSVSALSSSTDITVPSTGTGYYSPAGKIVNGELAVVPSSGDQLTININYNKNGSVNSKGYLDFIAVNARRKLEIQENDMEFCDPFSVGQGNVAEFQLSNASNLDQIWEVTDPTSPKLVTFSINGDFASFNVQHDSLRKFVAISGIGFPSPIILNEVIPQNLHGLGYADMIIISPASFSNAAQDLKVLHESEGLSVHLVTPEQIYNEFSSGMRDATAIKQFLRMFYKRSNGDPNLMPKYCLLFGDGTYDNRNRMGHGNNLIPVYESRESLSVTSTFATDDYYAILFDGGSMQNSDMLNIAIGRIPISNQTEASEMVQKIKNYSVVAGADSEIAVCGNGETSSVLRDWRNKVVMVSDDEDNNAYFNDIEIMSNKIDANHRDMNVVKIHSDAYGQESTPVGERIEGAESSIRESVEKGAVLVNYIGHGGETGWAHEQILTVPTIQSWTNYNRMPVFMTATCEFSRFDDHDRVSAGEYVLLNPDGGGIGLLTTTRLVYATPNEWLNRFFYDTVFDKVNDLPQRLGDIYMGTKNKFAMSSGDQNYRKFALLGDPAIRFSIPEYNIITDSINGIEISVFNDTIKALSTVRIHGHVEDQNGQKLTDFNGIAYNTVFDKISSLSTLGTNSGSFAATYEMWKNSIYKGKSSVVNGEFSFEFIVPQDISYDFGNARFSYYLENGTDDANGYNENVIIGGINTNASADNDGPVIELFLNDESFVSGGLTDENPSLLAKIYDESGINTVGNGIGHNIEAYLDDNTAESVILNDQYEADLDTYKSGQINYQLSEIEEGNHSITLKVWDVYNNSSKATIEFVVARTENLALSHVLNYPNPFTSRTEFYFEHNQVCDYLDVQIQIFTISGKLVKTINNRIHGEGFRSEGIPWNARDDFGDKIGRGVYVYTIKVSNERGEKVEKTEKLVILN